MALTSWVLFLCCSSPLLYVHVYVYFPSVSPHAHHWEGRSITMAVKASAAVLIHSSVINCQYAIVFKSEKLIYYYSSECFHLIVICTKSELCYYVSWLLHGKIYIVFFTSKIWEVVIFLLFISCFPWWYLLTFTFYLILHISTRNYSVGCQKGQQKFRKDWTFQWLRDRLLNA